MLHYNMQQPKRYSRILENADSGNRGFEKHTGDTNAIIHPPPPPLLEPHFHESPKFPELWFAEQELRSNPACGLARSEIQNSDSCQFPLECFEMVHVPVY